MKKLKINKHHLYLLSLIVLSLSCDTRTLKERGYNTKPIAEEIKRRKIKRITEQEINKWLTQRGKTIARLYQKAVSDQKSQSTLDSLSTSYRVKAKAFYLYEDNALEGKEKALWKAYIYSFEKKEPLTENLQKLDKNTYLYTHPISGKDPYDAVVFIYFDKSKVIEDIILE